MGLRHRTFSPLLLAALAVVLLVQTGVSRGQVKHFNPPKQAPEFNLPGLDGEKHALSDFRGQVLVLSVWASWCMPCREELPEFARARDELAGSHSEAVFMTVNLGESGARARSWMDRAGLDLPVLLASTKFMDEYGIMVVPSILVFDRDGRLAVLRSGWSPGMDLVEELSNDLSSLGKRAAR